MKNYSDSYNRLINAIVIAGDMLICGAAFLGMVKLTGYKVDMEAGVLSTLNVQILLTLMLCYGACAAHTGVVLYRRKAFAYEVVTRVVKNVIYFGATSGVILTLGHYINIWNPMFLFYLLAVLVLITTYRLLLRYAIKRYRTRGGNLRYVVLVGSTENMRELYHELTDQSWAGYRVLGYFDFLENAEFSKECTYLGKPQEVIPYLKEKQNAHFLYCFCPRRRKRPSYRSSVTARIIWCTFSVYRTYTTICTTGCTLT